MPDVTSSFEFLDGRLAADIGRAAEILRVGGIVAIPTDTVYGVSCRAFNAISVERVYQLKGRSTSAPVPLLIGTAAELSSLIETVPDEAWPLIESFWPGPLTLVLRARAGVPTWITRGRATLGVRVPASRSCLELLQLVNEPLVGTSANRSGEQPATSSAQVREYLGEVVDAVLADDASVQAGEASTVLELGESGAILHREGAIPLYRLREVFPGNIRRIAN